MKLLGIDYGKKKIGLALAEVDINNPVKGLAAPYKVFRVGSMNEAVRKLERVVQVEKVDQVVLGMSEGKMAEETMEFKKMIQERLNISISTQDETLTSKDAQTLSIEAGIKRKKRKEMEDAYSATLILQSYIENL